MKTGNMSSWISQSLERVTSLVSEIIRPYKATTHQNISLELHNILMDTGKDIVYEMENLEKDYDFIKKECALLERLKVLAESEKAKFQIELRKSHKECQQLKERLARSRNDKMVSELKNQLLEKDDTIRGYRQKLLFSDKKIADIQKEVKDLKDQKVALDGIIQGMRLKELEANNMVEELRRTYAKKASEIEKEFRCEMLAAENEKSRLEGIIEEMKRKEFEAGQTEEELRRLYLKECDDAVVLRNRLLVFEAGKMRVEEELKNLKDQKLELDGILDQMRLKQIEAHNTMEELKRTNLEFTENAKKLRCQMLAAETRYEETVQEMKHKEFEAHQTVEELRTRNLKACDDIVGLKNRIEEEKMRFETIIEEIKNIAHQTAEELRTHNLKACADIAGLKNHIEEENTRYETIIEEMKRKEFEADQTADDLRSRNLKAHDDIVDLRNRILDLEKDKRQSEQIISELRSKQMDDDQALDKLTHEHLEAIDDLKRKILKKSKETKEAKDANTSSCKVEKQNLESGSSISTERASNVPPQIEPIEVIDSDDEAIPGESTSNSELRPNQGEQENISSCPSSLQSGFVVDFSPKRRRSPRANGDDSSRPRKKQVPIPNHKSDVSLTADMLGNPNSCFTRNISPTNIKSDFQSELLKLNSSISEDSSDSDDDSLSDSHMEEMVKSLRR